MVDSMNMFLPEPVFTRTKQNIKIATPDIILDDENVPIEVMQDYIFAAVGGQEILSSTRHDIIGSPNKKAYSLVKDSGSKLSLQDPASRDSVTNTFAANLLDVNDYFPAVSDIGATCNATTKTLDMTLDNVPGRYFVEVEFLVVNDSVNDIMYKGDSRGI